METEPKSFRQLLHSVLLPKSRMEALTDGIFAISMTLLVLELKVPDLPKSVASHELLHKLGEEIPAFVSFLISFMYCGMLWAHHHLAIHFVKHLQAALVLLNLFFLMSISILPFSCAMLGHFFSNRAVQEIYFGNMLLAALLLLIQWRVAKRKKLLHEDDPRAAKAVGRQLLMVPVALAVGMLAALYRPLAGFYGMAVALLAMRVWQRRTFRRESQVPRSS